MKLDELPRRCFQGVMPAVMTTCDPSGTPNVTYLSQVFYLDAEHVALSCQFFNKTKQNVVVHPFASVQLYDPVSVEAYQLDLVYEREETSGPLFDQMAIRIDVIASHTGMKGVFKLRSADVYRVLDARKVSGFIVPPDLPPEEQPSSRRSEVRGLQLVSQRICRARDLDDLFSKVLGALAEGLGFEHSMVLLPDESRERLFAIASRGYGEGGIGAEIAVGEGLIGAVARERCILRVAGVGAELRYGRSIRASVHRATGPRGLAPEIPLPGLVDAQSQMAIPLLVGERLIGVLAVESSLPAAFDDWHEAYLEIVANQVAVAIENMTTDEGDTPAPPAPSGKVPIAVDLPTRKLRFFASDDCVFVGEEYLVRNLPGRILWKLLREHVHTGRTDFTNRELRLDPCLGLPPIRDNLESRLVLLRKRLAEKMPEIALVPTGRGLFRLDVKTRIELEETA